MAYQTMMIVYITISTTCVIGCIIATLLVYIDHAKSKRASSAEIAHLREEVRACRELLRRKESKGNA